MLEPLAARLRRLAGASAHVGPAFLHVWPLLGLVAAVISAVAGRRWG